MQAPHQDDGNNELVSQIARLYCGFGAAVCRRGSTLHLLAPAACPTTARPDRPAAVRVTFAEVPVFDSLLRDVASRAARPAIQRPTYAVVTIVTLALVIGAATAVLAVINATMLDRCRIRKPIGSCACPLQPPGTTELRQRNPLNMRTFVRFREGGLRLADAVEGFWARDRSLGGDGDPESVPGALASPGALPLLGRADPRPHLDRRGGPRQRQGGRARLRTVAAAFRRRSRRCSAGRVLVDREPHVVIGVMPAGFQAIYIESELWTPLNAAEPGHRDVLDVHPDRCAPAPRRDAGAAARRDGAGDGSRRLPSRRTRSRDGRRGVDGMRDAAVRASSGRRCSCCSLPSWRSTLIACGQPRQPDARASDVAARRDRAARGARRRACRACCGCSWSKA